MWQRIQTLYLFIAICINALFFAFGLVKASMDSILNRLATVLPGGEGQDETTLYASSLVLIVCLCSILLSAVIIFLYKKRQLQIKLGQLNLLVQVALIVSIFTSIDSLAATLELSEGFEIEYRFGTYLSLIPIVFIYLAIRAIKKDEALVRAADRIR